MVHSQVRKAIAKFRTCPTSDPRYADMANRSANIDALYAELSLIVLTRSTAQWLELLRDADIPHSEVAIFDSLLEDAHLKATGMLYEYEHPTEGKLRGVGIPTRFSRTPGNIRSVAARIFKG
jgi:crotonobetainyl-CoA:carnitine CoA-transferase CaiB-like acyl-CoA transferase